MKNPFKRIDFRVLRPMLYSMAALTILSVIVIVVVTQVRNRTRRAEYYEGLAARREAGKPGGDIGPEDFQLYSLVPGEGLFVPVLEPRVPWTNEELESYLIDPELLRFESLSESNDRLILNELEGDIQEGGEN